MRKAHAVGTLFASLLLTVALAAPAFSQIVGEPVSGFFGEVSGDPLLVSKGDQNRRAVPRLPGALTVAYDNTASAPNFGVSSTDLTAVWGDEVLTVATGLLSEHKFTIFNSGSSGGGSLLTCAVAVDFFDAPSATYYGGYTTNINFGAGLPVGFFSIVTVPGLDPLVISLPTTDLIVLQSVTAMTGTANRLGIASLNPPTVGASPGYMYIAAATIGGGVPGFYNFSGPANPGYSISLAPPPVHTASKTWGELKKLYR